ncbi:MAG: TadE/TadG family type IV pilus assembly protein [Methylocella sp.]
MLRRGGMCPEALGAFFGRERLAIAGVAAIELALVSPLLVTGVLGAAELGITIFRETQVQFAAQAGARYALSHGFNTANVSNAIVNATTYTAITATPAPTQFCGCPSATGVTPTGGAPPCSATCSGGATAGTYVTASSQAHFSPIIPNPWQADTVTLAAQLTVQIK